MKTRLFTYTFANLLLFFLLIGVPFRNNAQTKVAGEIVEIGCQAYWRKTEKSQEERLDAKRDKGRKLHVDEGVRCSKTGVLKIVVYGRAVNLVEAKGWYTIPENTKGEEDDTGGRRGEELSWLTGTYRLNKAESDDDSTPHMQFLKHSLKQPVQRKLFSDITPRYIAFKPEAQTLIFASSESQPFTLVADGQMRTASLDSNDVLKLRATGNTNELAVMLGLNDVTTEIKVEPMDQGKKLIFNWIFRKVGDPIPRLIKAVYERQSSTANLNLGYSRYKGTNSRLSTGIPMSPETGTDNVVAELSEPLSVKAPNLRSVSLRILKAENSQPASLTVRVKSQAEPGVEGPVLSLQFEAMHFLDLKLVFSGTLERITTANGEVLVDKADIREVPGDPKTFVLRRSFDIPAGARFILKQY